MTQRLHPVVDKWQRVLGAPVRSNNVVQYLVNGPATYEAMHEALLTTLTGATKTHYIYLLGWWLDDDLPLVAGNVDSTFASIAAEAARKGVEVRVMLWNNRLNANLVTQLTQLTHGSPAQRATALRELASHRSKYEADLYAILTDPIAPHARLRAQKAWIDNLENDCGRAVIDNHLSPFISHHQKVLITRGDEGLIAFCGGLDIAADRVEAVPGHSGSPFRDVQCRIQGAAAHDLLATFVQRWAVAAAAGEAHTADRLRGYKDSQGTAGPVSATANQYVKVVRTFVDKNRGCMAEGSTASTMLAAIRAAERFIYAEDQYLVHPEAAAAIGERLPKLQHVTIVIPHTAIIDLPGAWAARHRFIRTVFDHAGPADFKKFQVYFYYRPAGAPKKLNTRYFTDDFGPGSYVHSKVWIFDDELAIIGSANCNYRGWAYDSEVGAAIFDAPTSEGTFAQRFRVKLWSELFGRSLPESLLVPESVRAWSLPPAQRYVRRYDPLENTDATMAWLRGAGALLSQAPWMGPADDAAERLLFFIKNWVGDNPELVFRGCDSRRTP
ncbi:MAG TPA: phospholipase D-like domain-containing protein [Enhygromyxa sp.]|nr:phospholipase D-like domain-containing protein [Enhygromyxa sp.]